MLCELLVRQQRPCSAKEDRESGKDEFLFSFYSNLVAVLFFCASEHEGPAAKL